MNAQNPDMRSTLEWIENLCSTKHQLDASDTWDVITKVKVALAMEVNSESQSNHSPQPPPQEGQSRPAGHSPQTSTKP